MYNRYIPQPDGSFYRNRMPEPSHQSPTADASHSKNQPVNPPTPVPLPPRAANGNSIPGFFKQLLPKDLDTGDLIVILLLLLMAEDCEENRNQALLTIALYFFM